MKTWMINYLNEVRCHPLYVKSQLNHVTWMSYSLLHETKKKKKKTAEEILFLERFPWARFEKRGQMRPILSPPNPPPETRRAPKSLGSAPVTVVYTKFLPSSLLFFLFTSTLSSLFPSNVKNVVASVSRMFVIKSKFIGNDCTACGCRSGKWPVYLRIYVCVNKHSI